MSKAHDLVEYNAEELKKNTRDLLEMAIEAHKNPMITNIEEMTIILQNITIEITAILTANALTDVLKERQEDQNKKQTPTTKALKEEKEDLDENRILN